MATSSSLIGSDRGLHIVFLGDPKIGQSTMLKLFRNEGTTIMDILEDEKKDKGPLNFPEHQSYILDHVIDGEPFRIRFTDSGGLSCYDRVRKPILRTAHLVILCFDTTNRESMRNLEKVWLPVVKSLAGLESDHVFLKPYVVCGLRTDLTVCQINWCQE